MKTTQRRGVDDTGMQRLNLRISTEAYKRLGVHCTMSGETPRDVVARLIVNGLKDWSMPGKISARVKTNDRLDLDGSVSLGSLDVGGAVQA